MRIHMIVFGAATAALGMAHPAHAQDPNKFRFCAGMPGGNYEFVGIALERQLPGHIEGVHTKGSLENMERVESGDCQGGIVQSDAYFGYMRKHPTAQMHVERARDMYPEYGHLICNKTISELSDLTAKNTVLVGAAGSGSSVMWDAIVTANPQYKDVQTLPLGGTRALSKVTDGQEAQCMLFVAGLKAQVMMDANDMAVNANGNLHLTYMRDKKLFDIKDAKGRPVYTESEIPDGTYPKGLQATGWVSSGKAVSTIMVESVLIDNVDYADAHPTNIDLVLTGINKAMPAINQRVLPH